MTFGRLTVIKCGGPDKNHKMTWWCQCNCENKTIKKYIGTDLLSRKVQSCGCLHREIVAFNNKNNKKKTNKYDLSGEYGIGWTSNTNKEFYFDLEDYDKIKDYCWNEDNNGYLSTNIYKNTTIKFHRIILNMTKEDFKKVDHIKHNKLDNRKTELRICTNQNNCMNQGLSKNNTSGVTGVSFHKKTKKWQAYIKVNFRYIYLGLFADFDNAVKARKDAEEKYFGEYSYDNSIKNRR